MIKRDAWKVCTWYYVKARCSHIKSIRLWRYYALLTLTTFSMSTLAQWVFLEVAKSLGTRLNTSQPHQKEVLIRPSQGTLFFTMTFKLCGFRSYQWGVGLLAPQLTLQLASSSVSRLLSNLRSSRLEARLEEEAEWYDRFASISVAAHLPLAWCARSTL